MAAKKKIKKATKSKAKKVAKKKVVKSKSKAKPVAKAKKKVAKKSVAKPARKKATRTVKPKKAVVKKKIKKAAVKKVAKKAVAKKPKTKGLKILDNQNHTTMSRLEYIKNWEKIRLNRQVKAERRLNSYVNRIVKKYPEEFIEKIKEGIEDEDKFKESLTSVDSLEPHDITEDNEETEEEFIEKFAREIKIDD